MNRWPTKPLAEIATVIRGVSFEKSRVSDIQSKHSIPILRAGNIQDSLITDSDLVFVPETLVSEEQHMKRGDLAICMSSGSRAVVGKSSHLEADWRGSVGAFCSIIRFNPKYNHRFGSYWFRSPAFYLWRNGNAKGANIQNLRRAELEKLSVPVPSLAEQERIVKLLDEADELRKLRAQADRRTADLVPALFHDMFGDPEGNPKRWPLKKLGVITTIDAPMVDPRLKEFLDLPHVGPDRIESMTGKIFPTKTAWEDALVSGKYLFDARHVLYSKIRPYLRKAALPDFHGLCSADVYAVTPALEIICREYLWAVLLSERFTNYAAVHEKRANMPKLNRRQFCNYECPVPPLSLQKEFAQRVKDMREVEAGQAASRRRLEELFQSLLYRAFDGEL